MFSGWWAPANGLGFFEGFGTLDSDVPLWVTLCARHNRASPRSSDTASRALALPWCWQPPRSFCSFSTNHTCSMSLEFVLDTLYFPSFLIAFASHCLPRKRLEQRDCFGNSLILGICIHAGLLRAEAEQVLRWLAAEIVSRLAAFRPGTGVAGTAYVSVLQKEPCATQLMPLVEEHLLQLSPRSRVLTPRGIANLVSLLYGNLTDRTTGPGLTHLRDLAACHLTSFQAAELLDLASGLASCKKLNDDFLCEIRRAVDLAASAPLESHQNDLNLTRTNSVSHLPQILAQFFETLLISKPAGWSCATGGSAKVYGVPRLSEFLEAFKQFPVFQDPFADNGLAHRLDVETSGAMLVGTTFRSYWRLRLEFAAQEVKRQYLAVVHGTVLPLQIERELDLPLKITRVPRTRSDHFSNSSYSPHSPHSPHSVQSKSAVCFEAGRPGASWSIESGKGKCLKCGAT